MQKTPWKMDLSIVKSVTVVNLILSKLTMLTVAELYISSAP